MLEYVNNDGMVFKNSCRCLVSRILGHQPLTIAVKFNPCLGSRVAHEFSGDNTHNTLLAS